MGKAPWFFAASTLMVLMQVVTVAAVWAGGMYPACQSNQHCRSEGEFCSLGSSGRCWSCRQDGTGRPIVLHKEAHACFAGGILSTGESCATECPTCAYGRRDHPSVLSNAPGFFDADLKNNVTGILAVCDDPSKGQWGWRPQGDTRPDTSPREGILAFCDGCVHAATGDIDMTTESSKLVENILAMTTFDWLALPFCSLVVALNVIGELKDIKLCVAAVDNAGADLYRGWRFALLALNAVRRMYLPFLVSVVAVLVAVQGGDALSVCLNTIAVREQTFACSSRSMMSHSHS